MSDRQLTTGDPVPEDRSHTEIDPRTGQQRAYVVLTPEERAKGFVKPVRRSYVHGTCGSLTTMGTALAETYARDPNFYSGTFCCVCREHFPLHEFKWEDGEPMNPAEQPEWNRHRLAAETERRAREAADLERRERAELARLKHKYECSPPTSAVHKGEFLMDQLLTRIPRRSERLKKHYLGRVRAHQKADQIVQSYGYWRNGRGCAVGCTLHSGRHSQYPIEMGIPEELAYLEDHFFERLPVADAKKWPALFLSSIKTGADLSRVYDLWSAWNLIDPVDGVITQVRDAYPAVQRFVRETGEACLAGERINAARAAEAAEAAGAAGAAMAAEAAWAARAARAAEAAEAAEAAWAAWAAYYKRASDKLIELLKAAPMATAKSSAEPK